LSCIIYYSQHISAMNEEDFIREMNDQDMDTDQYDDIYEVDIDYTTQT